MVNFRPGFILMKTNQNNLPVFFQGALISQFVGCRYVEDSTVTGRNDSVSVQRTLHGVTFQRFANDIFA